MMKLYTDEKQTAAYLKRLDSWSKKILSCSEEELDGDLWGYSVRNFPINKVGHVLLMLDVNFLHSSLEIPSKICYDDSMRLTPATVSSVIDEDYEEIFARQITDSILELRLKDNSCWYTDAYIGAYGDSPPYIFLPHPSSLKDFKRFLHHLDEKPKKLEKILDRYYSKVYN